MITMRISPRQCNRSDGGMRWPEHASAGAGSGHHRQVNDSTPNRKLSWWLALFRQGMAPRPAGRRGGNWGVRRRAALHRMCFGLVRVRAVIRSGTIAPVPARVTRIDGFTRARSRRAVPGPARQGRCPPNPCRLDVPPVASIPGGEGPSIPGGEGPSRRPIASSCRPCSQPSRSERWRRVSTAGS